MNKERRVLAAIIHDRSAYSGIAAHLKETDFTAQGWLIAAQVQEFYDADPSIKHVDKDWLRDIIKGKYPKHAEVINGVISALEDVSVPNVVREYKELRKEALRAELAEALLNNSETVPDLIESLQLLDHDEGVEEAQFYENVDLEEILTVFQPENLIKVHPPCLNRRLDGGLQPGNQVVIYAPTEVGKSLFAVNMAAGLCREGRKVLYCGNEDPAKSMIVRFVSRFSGMDKHQILADHHKAKELADRNGMRNLVFYDMSPGTIQEVRRAVEKRKPDVVFIDQMANMSTTGGFSKTEKNEYLSVKFREIAKKYGVVSVLVHQASADAYGKLRLEKGDLYYSNVGVQGQMDVMIGIGMDDSYEMSNTRMISLTKNKLSGNHESFPVQVQPELSKVISLEK